MTLMLLDNFYRLEAEDYLAALDSAARAEPLEIESARRSARALRGVARLAGETRTQRAAEALEVAVRTAEPETIETLAPLLIDAVPHIRALFAADAAADVLDAHVDAVVERCREDRSPLPLLPEPGEEQSDEAFLEFVGREAGAIADETDAAIAAFQTDPSNREILGTILRRQRALLGSARLDDVPIVTETLRAVEGLAELIVRLDVPIKSEWLDVFRCARDVLRSASGSLVSNERPGPVPALSRLRTIRDELMDRYGEHEPVAPSRPLVTQPADRAETVDDLRARAGILRSDLLNAIGANPRARAALEELFGLAMRALN